MAELYYRPSGHLPPGVVFWAFMTSMALMPVGWAYAWLNHFGPAGPLALLYSTVFSACCARAAFLTAQWGKARNPPGMALIGAAIGLIAWYWQWVVWLNMASEQPAVAALFDGSPHTMIDIATAPGRMYVVAGQIRDAGLVAIKSPDIAWTLELLFVTGMSAMFAYGKAIAPFCETGDKWGEVIELPKKHAFIAAEAEFAKQLEADPRGTLDSVTSFLASDSGFSSITIICCRASGKAFLTVHNTELSVKDGAEKTKKRTLISKLSIDLALADDVLRQSANGGSLQAARSGETNPPELQPAIDHLEAGDYDAALASAAPHLVADDARLCKDATRLSALVCSRMAQWDAALGYWRRLFDREATAHNALQLATASVMAGNVPLGEVWMRTAVRLNETSGDCPWLQVTTNFITALKNSGNAKLALPYLNEVKAIYERLHITDDTFLCIRGVPFFSSFLDNSRAVVTDAMSKPEATRWYESMIPHIDHDGQIQLKLWLQEGMPERSRSTA